MTAVIGVLNKNAVVMAADSAVTITSSNNDSKVFNNANKLFALSKHHPVGIMIYDNAEFMGVPWETIIKIYRNQLGKKSFPHLANYQEDFIDFIKKKEYFGSSQEKYFDSFALEVILDCWPTEIAKENLPNNIVKIFHRNLISVEMVCSSHQKSTDFQTLSFEDFATNPNFDLAFVKNEFLQLNITIDDNIFNQIQKTVYAVLCSNINFGSQHTGLVFTGFGEDEVFPSLIALDIFFAIDDKLRYNISTKEEINQNNNAAIRPFAQTDVIDTILLGADPKLKAGFEKSFIDALDKYHQTIIQVLGVNSELSKKLIQLDLTSFKNTIAMQNQILQENYYIRPLISTIASLSKEDLAEMAESLIHLTYLKRRITNAQESVGGPVDVAIISKGDGFVWIKRKHYFDKDLNKPFFDNYFN
jgi:hypothetical protein